MNRRAFLSTMSLLGLWPLMSGCERGISPLRVATNPWIGYEFMFLARRENWISVQDIVLVEAGSATGALDLLAAGKADGAALTLDEVLRGRERGLALTAVLVFDVSLGADVLLAKPGIDALARLKHKRIGFEPSGVGALMLTKALEAAGLRTSDVTAVPTKFDQHEKVWRAGDIDALITFEPAASRLEAEGALRLFDSSKIPDTVIDVLAVTPTAADRHHEALHSLVEAHFRALAHFRQNPYDAAHRMAEHLKMSPKQVMGAFKGLELPNESRNRKLLRGNESSLVKTAQELGAVMVQAGLLKNGQTDVSRLVSADFLPRVETK